MKKNILKVAISSAIVAASLNVKAAESVEVLHWWTSGGEASALDILRAGLQEKGIGWQDMPVAGGGGSQATTVLRARVTGNNPPTAAQMLGYDVLDWGKIDGAVANLNDIAAQENWDELVPEALQFFSKYEGNWIAAPVNVHSSNWIWINKEQFEKVNGKIPTNWDELVGLLDAFKAAGITPLAHGGQAWQEVVIFDSIILSLGKDFYRSAMIDLDPAAIKSPKMLEAFKRMGTLRKYVDDNFSGRDWNLASAMVIEGKAGMQIQGDWAKGEFVNAGKVPDEDFICIRYPGTEGSTVFLADQFVMFEVDESKKNAQKEMAKGIMGLEFQSAFNVAKGSAPARMDVPDSAFDSCGKKAIADLKASNASGSMFGSIAHGHAVPSIVKGAIYDVVTAHFNGEYTAAEAVEELAVAIDSTR